MWITELKTKYSESWDWVCIHCCYDASMVHTTDYSQPKCHGITFCTTKVWKSHACLRMNTMINPLVSCLVHSQCIIQLVKQIQEYLFFCIKSQELQLWGLTSLTLLNTWLVLGMFYGSVKKYISLQLTDLHPNYSWLLVPYLWIFYYYLIYHSQIRNIARWENIKIQYIYSYNHVSIVSGHN